MVTSDSGSMEQYILMHIMNSKAMHCQQKRFRFNGAVYIGAHNEFEGYALSAEAIQAQWSSIYQCT